MKEYTTISNKRVAHYGALIAVASVFAYSLVVMFYAIIRSSTSIYSIMTASERSDILITNSFSIAYSVVVFSLLMAVVSAIAGMVAGMILRMVLWQFNPQFRFKKAILISSITSLVLLLLLYLLLYVLLKERITMQYSETFFFWFVYPAIIFFIVVIISGVALNKQFIKMKIE